MTLQPFVQYSDPAVQTSCEPGDLFSPCFTQDTIGNIVQETNIYYAAQWQAGT